MRWMGRMDGTSGTPTQEGQTNMTIEIVMQMKTEELKKSQLWTNKKPLKPINISKYIMMR